MRNMQQGGSSIDWREAIVAAARHFRGDPNPRLSSSQNVKLCWGTRGSPVVWTSPSPRSGTFTDFEADHKGGVLDFLRHEAGMNKDAARRWLRERGLIAGSAALLLPASPQRLALG